MFQWSVLSGVGACGGIGQPVGRHACLLEPGVSRLGCALSNAAPNVRQQSDRLQISLVLDHATSRWMRLCFPCWCKRNVHIRRRAPGVRDRFGAMITFEDRKTAVLKMLPSPHE